MVKKERRFHKIRIIQCGGGDISYGVTIPNSLSSWFGLYVNIKESGNCLILQSGAIPSAFSVSQLKTYGKVIDKVKF